MKNKDKVRTVSAILKSTPKYKVVDKISDIFHRRTLPERNRIYVFCRNREISDLFLRDAEAEGFFFADGGLPTSKDYSDIYAVYPSKVISYVGWAGHVLFRNAGSMTPAQTGGLVRVDYEKYIRGNKEYVM